MKVADHEPQTWFLLEESGRYYFDARVTRAGSDWSILLQLTPQEDREYHAIGRLYLCYLAARIHNFADEYSDRDLNKGLGEEVTRAIEQWRIETEKAPIRPMQGLGDLSRNDCDATVGDVSLHALSRGESRVLQPVAAQTQMRNFRWSWPATV